MHSHLECSGVKVIVSFSRDEVLNLWQGLNDIKDDHPLGNELQNLYIILDDKIREICKITCA